MASQYIYASNSFPTLLWKPISTIFLSTDVRFQFLQMETGFVMKNTETSLTKEKTFACNTTLLRYGLLENLELRLGMEYSGNQVSVKKTDSTNTVSGFSPVYAGFKVFIAEEDGWKPEIAFLGGLVLPFTAHHHFKPGYSAADIRFAFSHTLSERLSLGYYLGVSWNGDDALPAYFYSLAPGIGISDKLGMFIEGYGWQTEDGTSEPLLDAGFTYMLLPNFQLDISGGIGLNDNTPDHFVSLGLTYQLPK